MLRNSNNWEDVDLKLEVVSINENRRLNWGGQVFHTTGDAKRFPILISLPPLFR